MIGTDAITHLIKTLATTHLFAPQSAHDHFSGGFSRTHGRARLPNQFIGRYGPSPYRELTARCYHALQTPPAPLLI